MRINTELFDEHIKRAIINTFDSRVSSLDIGCKSIMTLSDAKKSIVLEIADSEIQYVEHTYYPDSPIRDINRDIFIHNPKQLCNIRLDCSAFSRPKPYPTWRLDIIMDRLYKIQAEVLSNDNIQYLDIEEYVCLELNLALSKFKLLCERYGVDLDRKRYAIMNDNSEIYAAEDNYSRGVKIKSINQYLDHVYSTKLTRDVIIAGYFTMDDRDKLIKFRTRLGW
jgi:hypothetical protein